MQDKYPWLCSISGIFIQNLFSCIISIPFLSVFVFRAMVISVSFMIGSWGKTIFAMSGITEMCYGPISTLFFMALLFPRETWPWHRSLYHGDLARETTSWTTSSVGNWVYYQSGITASSSFVKDSIVYDFVSPTLDYVTESTDLM